MAKLTEKMLARYYDGELSPKQAQKVEKILAESKAHESSLNNMVRIGDLLRLMNEENLNDVSFDGFHEKVKTGIKRQQTPGIMERIGVWVSEFFEYRPAIWVPSFAVAAAAVALLLILPIVTGSPETAPSSAPTPDIWMAANDTQPVTFGSRIESVSFGEADGLKYDITNGQGGTVGVVWIVEKP